MTNHSAATTQFRRSPKQGRSKALVDAICQSCLKIINSGRGDELSVSLIIKTAGVTKSSFYQYFPNVDTAIGHALTHYDLGYDEEDILLDEQLREKLSQLSLTDAIELVVNAACDRHVRLLKKYGSIYRRFHRNFSPMANVENGFDSVSVSTGAEIGEFVQCLLEGNTPSLKNCSIDAVVFLVAVGIVDFTGKTVDFEPRLLEQESFRKTLTGFFSSYFLQ